MKRKLPSDEELEESRQLAQHWLDEYTRTGNFMYYGKYTRIRDVVRYYEWVVSLEQDG